MSTIIKVENLSKKYVIGHQREESYTTLRDVMMHKMRGIGERLRHPLSPNREETDLEEFWALKDINFEIKQGERVGIIGRNGAGKSTLLKILSRITEPTTGRIKITGRVASLLEVGTGFHPELTGRENIFLNGAILGMSRADIKKNFDEIVAFAEVEKFLDTPVKRYSSGMYVRLAFAVAAHLEPEILIVDEVLAVGDAQFQKKCLGKMNDVAKGGRTVLFVSHNMAMIRNLCARCVLLVNGQIDAAGATQEVVEKYLSTVSNMTSLNLGEREDRRGEGLFRFTQIELLNDKYEAVEQIASGNKLIIRLHYKTNSDDIFKNCRASVSVHGYGNTYFLASTELVCSKELSLKGKGYFDCIIDEIPLSKGEYYLNPFLESNKVIQDWIEAAVKLSVSDGDFYGTGRNYPSGWEGKTVLVKHRWEW